MSHDQHKQQKENNRLMIAMDRKREGQRIKRASGDFQFAIDRSHGKALSRRNVKSDAIKKRMK